MNPTELATRALEQPASATVNPGSKVSICLRDDNRAVVSLRQLQALAVAFGADDVAVTYTKETGPWSDVTGGESSEFMIEASGVKVPLTWTETRWDYGKSREFGYRLRDGVIEEDPLFAQPVPSGSR